MARRSFASKCIRARAVTRRRVAPIALLLAAVLCSLAAPADAHGFGERYELPLPLSFYLFGAGAAVVFTFVVAGLFVRHAPATDRYPRLVLNAAPLRWIVQSSGLAFALKSIALALFVITVMAGFMGHPNPYRNLAPTMIWIIAWVGLAYVSAFVGNLWALINPWATVFEWSESLYRRIRGRETFALNASYPQSLGVWPAFFFLFAFSWIELVYPDPAVPAKLSCFAVGYSVLTWIGMYVFGSGPWLRHGEVFSVLFGVFARFAPTEIDQKGTDRRLALRPFGVGLLDSSAISISMTAFVLLVLSTVLYDGFSTTPAGFYTESSVAEYLGVFGERGLMLVKTCGLVAFWLLFFGAYVAVCAIMDGLVSEHQSPFESARRFALTLVPIAIGYHVAHYFVFLLVQGQYIIPLVSDPFGYGWNLFGTAPYRVDIAIVDARFAWYTALLAIVLGHIAAVYLAHAQAMRVFSERGPALRSQIPLTALMVIYTFVSLSILSEPIIELRAPGQPAAAASATIGVPADAVLPEPGEGRLQRVPPETSAKVKLTYRLLGSAFHDGTRTSVADLLYSYMFAYRWGSRTEGQNSHYDPFVASATAPLRQQLVGLRVVGSDAISKSFRVADVNFVRELFTIDVYANVVQENPEQDAILAPPWSTIPWHLIVLMEESVERGWAAFSKSEAARRGIEWLDLVRSEPTKQRLMTLVETFERDGYRPGTLRSLVSVDEARKRWAALAAYYKARGHFLVTNGPYLLNRWSTEGIALEAFRDLSYPLGVGSYDAYAIPRRGFITKVEWSGERVMLSGDIEIVRKFQRSYELVRTPLPSVSSDVMKRSAPECRYTVIDEGGRVVLAGLADPGENFTFQVDFSGRLPAGRYTMFAVIAPNGNVMNPEIRRIPVVISAKP